MAFTDQLWSMIQPIYNKILELPFNQELMDGSLPEEKFIFYLKQDSYYLADFTRALSLAGLRSQDMEYLQSYLEFALGAVSVERALHESYFDRYDIPEHIEKSPTCFNYTNFLLSTAALDSNAVGIAALLPCFWIYREVGLHIYDRASKNNPYRDWIDTYAGKDFSESVDRAIEITAQVAEEVTPKERDRMREAFIYSTRLEWMFWDSAYQLETWKPKVGVLES